MVPSSDLGKAADPLAYALNATGMTGIAQDRRARRGVLDGGGAAGVPVRPAAHLLRDGARRPAAAVGGEGEPEDARAVRRRRCSPASFVALWSLIGDADETYDLTNIGTLFAFVLVCIGVMVLRHTDPDRPRPFRVPFVYVVGIARRDLCVIVMYGLPALGVGAVRLVARRSGLAAVLRLRLPALHPPPSGRRTGGRLICDRRDATRERRRAAALAGPSRDHADAVDRHRDGRRRPASATCSPIVPGQTGFAGDGPAGAVDHLPADDQVADRAAALRDARRRHRRPRRRHEARRQARASGRSSTSRSSRRSRSSSGCSR